MSGLGGNLTYPANKQFRNSFGVIDPTASGSEGIEFRLIEDLQAQEGVTGVKTLFIESTGDYIPGGAQASYTRVDHKDSASRVVGLVLEDRGPMDESTHELGFTVEAVAQHPGVFNDNLFGQRRTYAHKFKYLDAVVAGLISDLDIMRAYADINQQITDDSGRYSGGLQGNVESVVNAVTTMIFSGDVSADTFDVPAANLWGETLSNCSDYIDSPLTISAAAVTVGSTVIGESYLVIANSVALSMYVGQTVTTSVGADAGAHIVTKIVKGTTNSYIYFDFVWTAAEAVTFETVGDPDIVNNSAVAVTYPGYGFIVHMAAETLDSHLITLDTKDTFKNLTTFNVEKLDGIKTTITAGAFELLPWAEVFREFSHMAHDVPLSNHHDIAKPSSTYPWVKFILNTNHRNASMHGASHHGSYLEEIILFLPNNGVSTGNAGCISDVEDLLIVWST